jgi:transaldolase
MKFFLDTANIKEIRVNHPLTDKGLTAFPKDWDKLKT